MNAPALTLVPAAAPASTNHADRMHAHGQMMVAADAFTHAAEALHSAAYWLEKSAREGGGYSSDLLMIERARDLIRETTRRVDAAVGHFEANKRRRG